MDTLTSSSAHAELMRALTSIEHAEDCRRTSQCRRLSPHLKSLVLKVAPTASVHRIGSWDGRRITSAVAFECFIGDQRISERGCTGAHSTSNKAWICLARYVINHGGVQA